MLNTRIPLLFVEEIQQGPPHTHTHTKGLSICLESEINAYYLRHNQTYTSIYTCI